MQIEVQALSKRYGRVEALREVTFSVPPGRRLALIGPNGSGKSTLTRVLMGLISFEGVVTIDGCSPFGDRATLGAKLAYVPQIAPRIAAPVSELLQAVSRLRGLENGAVAEVARELDLDVAGLARRPFSGLSGGMKQKLLLAMALASRASLLVLDEPTGSLDAAARERFLALAGSISPGTTLVLCSHRLEEVRQLVDHVLALAEGRLSYDGSAMDFLARSARCLIEVRAEDAAAGWLEKRGFRPTVSGWWVRAATHAEKLELLPELTSCLGTALLDLNVRDLEFVEPEWPAPDRGESRV